MATSSTAGSSSTGSPCGACKFLRRKCASDCIFAPYFCSDQGSTQFAAIHKVFGASNVSKMLSQVPVSDRCEAVVTIAYEAQARIRDPVYGCVAHIFALQQQVAFLQTQLMQVKVQMANNLVDSRADENHWRGNMVEEGLQHMPYPSHMNSISPQSSIDSVDSNSTDRMEFQNVEANDDYHFQTSSKKRMPQNDLGELQALALRMMRN
ncbi:Lob domain-containing protein [Thalictrum thalictroides]|uniref:Lob domain-containing protein n=1 Tax=Thalictrum thalictroides TaxID=46969 RepID=A0A7J6WFS3_THATH|nr:Lob domain-containing protein [Thalictrum thalictroides]